MRLFMMVERTNPVSALPVPAFLRCAFALHLKLEWVFPLLLGSDGPRQTRKAPSLGCFPVPRALLLPLAYSSG
jgi:hypothetical protein